VNRAFPYEFSRKKTRKKKTSHEINMYKLIRMKFKMESERYFTIKVKLG